MTDLDLQKVGIDQLQIAAFNKPGIAVNVLRLDKIHPQISGNKWLKLKEYLQQAQQLNKNTILTFGGAYSNHILATAAACSLFGLKSVGIIRGEKPPVVSPTLREALGFGMELVFVARTVYQSKQLPQEVMQQYRDAYIINEGGYGELGMRGTKAILHHWNKTDYTHIGAAVGTGTTLAGLTASAFSHQKTIGISVMKNNYSLRDEVKNLIKEDSCSFEIIHDYHFGGYAKFTPQLLQFMNEWYEQTGIRSDFVYTGKLFYGIYDLVQRSYFPFGSKILIIHSGGLQGNRSLPSGALLY